MLSEEGVAPGQDLDASLPADIRQAVKQQILSHEWHPQVGLQCQDMHFQAWKEFAEASAFCCK